MSLTLTGLTCTTATESEFRDPLLKRIVISNEEMPGFLRQLHVAATGVALVCQGNLVFIPAAELWALAEAANPSFAPPKPQVTIPKRDAQASD